MYRIKNQKGQAIIEFSISIIILFLFCFALIGSTYWGAASFLTQEIAHETARKYAVTENKERAETFGKTYMDRWGYIFIKDTQISIASEGDKATAVVTATPRISDLFVFRMPAMAGIFRLRLRNSRVHSRNDIASKTNQIIVRHS